MQTQIYQTWVSNASACGLTTEQSCGLAMLLAWNLGINNNEGSSGEDGVYWKFVQKDDFMQISESSFLFEDFIKFVPLMKIAGEMLQVSIPKDRADGKGETAFVLNLDWQDKPIVNPEIGKKLLLRHRFDLHWCQKVGESLRDEIKTPACAYAFADYVAQAFNVVDPEGFSRILHGLLWHPSPFVRTFCSKYFAIERPELERDEPFQIALLGFMGGMDPALGEELWNIQRLLFYRQPGGEPFNLEKQFVASGEFLEFCLPLVTDFIDKNRLHFLQVGKLVSSEYLFRSAGFNPFDHFSELMNIRYGFAPDLEVDSKPLALLVNAAIFYTLCCLKIRNLSNKIDELPTLRMLEDSGSLWARDAVEKGNLLHEATTCFDVMLSWRFGASWALFLETEHGFIQRVYVGDSSDYQQVEEFFAKICAAYVPSLCVVAFWAHRPAGGGSIIEEVFFLTLARAQAPRLDVFQGESSVERGRFLGSYAGHSEDEQLCGNYFPKLRGLFMTLPTLDIVESAQNTLLEIIPSFSAWNFVSRLKQIWVSDSEITYADLEDVSHDGDKTLMWLLIDYLRPQKTVNDLPFRSSKVLFEYDCLNQTRKFLAIKLFDLGMGSGECIHSGTELKADASAVPPQGTVGHEAWRRACELNVANQLMRG